MTKTITKKPIIATIAVTILLGTVLIASNTFTNNVVAQTASPSSPCPPDGEVQHWDKIVFQIKDDSSKTIPKDMLKKTLDLKILDTPEEVVDLEQEVKNAVGVKFGVDPADLKIKIIDVLYQTVTCGITGPQGPQGPQGEQGPPGQDAAQAEDFIEPTLLNGWVNFGSGHSPTGYYMDSDDVVHFRGAVKFGSPGSGVFNLQEDYRPEFIIQLLTTNVGDFPSKIVIEPDGDVIILVGAESFTSLDGITFRAAP